MRLLPGQIVLAIAAVAAILIFIALRPMHFAMDVALCVGYTVLVFGDLVVDRFFTPQRTKAAMTVGRTLGVHACFLLAVIGVVRIVAHLKPADVDWAPHPGAGINWYLLVAIAVPILLAFVEKSFLFRPHDRSAAA
jgi:hypothetical protein